MNTHTMYSRGGVYSYARPATKRRSAFWRVTRVFAEALVWIAATMLLLNVLVSV